MKYFTRTNTYKASNVSFDANTLTALSYNWWEFVKVINGLLIFNNFNYSATTGRHQHKVRRLLGSLGIRIDIEIAAPLGLQNINSAITYYMLNIEDLKEKIANPRSNRKKNIERQQDILKNATKLEQAQAIINMQNNRAA